jgi:D-alanine--poly(phosphoribitol) ligase subunit 1
MKILYNLEKQILKNKDQHVIEYRSKKISYKNFWIEVVSLANYFYLNNFNKICIIETENENFFYYIAMFASLISGKTYIPINANTPKKRIETIIDISKTDLIITSRKKIHSDAIILEPKNIKKIKIVKKFKIKKSNKDAYIIFTSGSTGQPKGVRISRISLDKYILWLSNYFFKDKIIRCSQHPGIGFDLSVADIYGTICNGGKLFPLKNKLEKFFLKKFIMKNKISHWVSVPSLSDIIFDGKNNINDFKNLKKIFFCGETLKKSHLQKIFNSSRQIQVFNAYGPTETTVSCTVKELNYKNFKKFCKPSASFGKPIPGIKLSFKDNKTKEGEMIITGDQVSTGYLNNSNLNKIKFFKKGNKRSFITGDICKKINGEYYFVNRKDRQIKLNGHRIELDEIDNVISDKIGHTSLSIKFNNKIYTFINGYFDNNKLLSYIKKRLPNYMIPSKLYFIKVWPKNKNLKTDETKLLKIIKLQKI